MIVLHSAIIIEIETKQPRAIVQAIQIEIRFICEIVLDLIAAVYVRSVGI